MYYLVYPVSVALPVYLVWSFSTWGSILLNWVLFPILLLACAIPVFVVFLVTFSYIYDVCDSVPFDSETYLVYNTIELKTLYSNKRIPIETLYENYMKGDVDVKGDLLEALYHRQSFSNFHLTMAHVKFFFGKLVPENIDKSLFQNKEQVSSSNERGNDFYNWFLGASMVYTSGILFLISF